MSDEEARNLERKAAEGDTDAAATLMAVQARTAAPVASYSLAEACVYTPTEALLRSAVKAGLSPTMELKEGDLVLVNKLDPSVDANYKGLWLGVVRTVAQQGQRLATITPIDLLDATSPLAGNVYDADVTKLDKVMVLRRKGRPLQ